MLVGWLLLLVYTKTLHFFLGLLSPGSFIYGTLFLEDINHWPTALILFSICLKSVHLFHFDSQTKRCTTTHQHSELQIWKNDTILTLPNPTQTSMLYSSHYSINLLTTPSIVSECSYQTFLEISVSFTLKSLLDSTTHTSQYIHLWSNPREESSGCNESTG